MGARRSSLLVACLVAVAVVGGAPGVGASAAAATTMKLGSLAPEGSSWAALMHEVAEDVTRSTDGAVRPKLFLGGALGDEPDMVRKMRINQLQAGAFTLNGLYRIAPEMSVLSLPFLFRDVAEVDHVREALFDRFAGYFEERGFVLLALLDQAPHVHFYTKEPATTLEALRQQKMWVWADERLATATYEALGITPVPVDVPQVATSLQTGLINGLYTGPYTLMALQWHPYVNHVLLVNLRYEPGAMVVTKSFWDALDDEGRDAVRGAVEKIVPKEIEMVRRDEAEALDLLRQEGKTVVELSPEERTRFEQATRRVWDDLAGSMYPRELLDAVLAELEALRSGTR